MLSASAVSRGASLWMGRGNRVWGAAAARGTRGLRAVSERECVSDAARHSPPCADAESVLANTADMCLTFVGTSSAVPTASRGASCLALKYQGDIWLFDCGEGTQQQLVKMHIKPTAIKKIFITHMHGDHCFGLPGVLCYIGMSLPEDQAEIDIYGPEGLRSFLKATVELSYSKVVPRYRVHELKDVPLLSRRSDLPLEPPPSPVTVTGNPRLRCREDSSGSRDIYPDENYAYDVVTPSRFATAMRGRALSANSRGIKKIKENVSKLSKPPTCLGEDSSGSVDEDVYLSVRAAPMNHTIPCVGYVIREMDRPGQLHPERVADTIRRNHSRLTGYLGIKTPAEIYKRLKEMKPGETFTFPDGTVVEADAILGKPQKGRKLVIMGDTCSGALIKPLAMDADVLVHEATNAYIPGYFTCGYHETFPSAAAFDKEMLIRGHSTPEMAGKFAASTRAKLLVLTHFSARYNGDQKLQSVGIMGQIENLAGKAAKQEHLKARTASNKEDRGQFKMEVMAAWDSLVVPVTIESRRIERNDEQTSDGSHTNPHTNNSHTRSEDGLHSTGANTKFSVSKKSSTIRSIDDAEPALDMF